MAPEPIPPQGSRRGSGARLETSAAGPSGIATARRAATEHLQGCGCTNVDDAVLVLSELVTNAVVHAGGADRILVSRDDVQIHISVHDHGTEPAVLREDTPGLGGRGLRIVDRIADDWGSEFFGDVKDVWATLPCGLVRGPAWVAHDSGA